MVRQTSQCHRNVSDKARSTKSSKPSCVKVDYLDGTMSQWSCGNFDTTYNLNVKTQMYYPDTSSTDSITTSSSSPPTQSTESSESTTNASSTSSTTSSIGPSPEPSSRISSEGEIIGGAVGGVGAVVLAVAALLFWSHRRKRDAGLAGPSFKVLGSNVPLNLNQTEKPTDLPPDFASPLSASVEVDASDIGGVHLLHAKSSSIYQPYRPGSAISQPTPHSAYQSSKISPSPSFNQGYQYPSRSNVGSPELVPISEVDGSSTSFLRPSTPTLPDPPSRREVAPVELEDTTNMSKQSGPIPDWK